MGEPFQQKVRDERFSGPGVTGQNDNALIVFQGAGEAAQDELVGRGRVVKLGIRRGAEWPRPHSKVIRVHRCAAPNEAPRPDRIPQNVTIDSKGPGLERKARTTGAGAPTALGEPAAETGAAAGVQPA